LLYTVAGNADEAAAVEHAVGAMHGAISDQCNVAVQLHTKAKTEQYWISSQGVVTQQLKRRADASLPQTLTGFLNAAHERCPASATALVLWAHGCGMEVVREQPFPLVPGSVAGKAVFDPGQSGTAPGRPAVPASKSKQTGCLWGPDPSSQRYMTSIGIRQAIAASAIHRVDVLGLNACTMASLDVEYELRGVSGVQVASQLNARPWDYGAIVQTLATSPAPTSRLLAMAIVNSVREAPVNDNGARDTVSALVSAAMDGLASAFDAFARRATELVGRDWPAVRQAVMDEAWRVDDPYQVDLKSLIDVLGAGDHGTRAAAQSVESKLRAARLAFVPQPEQDSRIHGLSIFCPKLSHVDVGKSYEDMQFRSNSWLTFLRAFQSKLSHSA
jgi:hypothetical protein